MEPDSDDTITVSVDLPVEPEVVVPEVPDTTIIVNTDAPPVEPIPASDAVEVAALQMITDRLAQVEAQNTELLNEVAELRSAQIVAEATPEPVVEAPEPEREPDTPPSREHAWFKTRGRK